MGREIDPSQISQPQGGRLAGSCNQAKAEAHYRQAALPIKRACADAVAKARLDFTYGKRGRLYVHEAKFEAGLVLFPKNAPFLPELEAELLTFPQGKTDDQVDSISQALSYEPGQP